MNRQMTKTGANNNNIGQNHYQSCNTNNRLPKY